MDGLHLSPVTGCTKIAPGCKHCYAESIAKRFWKGRAFTDVQCHEDRLDIPFHWRKPRKTFVCSMSDLFHEKVPFEFIDKVFDVIRRTPDHTYQILTKRPKRMADFIYQAYGVNHKLDNAWLGTSISTQVDADKNIPILLQIPAAVRFVSIEPMLGNVALDSIFIKQRIRKSPGYFMSALPGLHWVIIGCESGPGARLCSIEDIRATVKQCKDANVPVFVKQVPVNGKCNKNPDDWDEDLRVQEYPK